MSWFKWANPAAPVQKPAQKPAAKPVTKPAVPNAWSNGGAGWQAKVQATPVPAQVEYEEQQMEQEEAAEEVDEAADEAEALDFLAELEGAHLEDEEEDDEAGGEPVVTSGNDFEMLKAALLSRLAANKGPMSAGKLGHDVGAKKKPIIAALYSLAEAGTVQKTDDQYPKWKVIGVARPLGNVKVPARFLYAQTATRTARPTAQDFETLKLLVRSNFAGNPGGVTAGALGYKIGATKKVINAALYRCEQEGNAWTVGQRQAGAKLRWTGNAAKCNAALPAAFSYQEVKAAAAVQPPAKRLKTSHSGGGGYSTGDDFKDLQLLLHGQVAAAGERGVTSGALGYNLAADRKAITAALHKCQAEGLVQSSFEGKAKSPTWVSLKPPPAHALSVELPARFSYKGDKLAPDVDVQPQAVVQPQVVANLATLSEADKRKALLARKGGGKGQAAAPVPAAAVAAKANAAASASGGNMIAFLNEWSQKNRQTLSFSDAGQAGSQFVCKVIIGDKEVASASARSKKQAKANAAALAVQKLGLQ